MYFVINHQNPLRGLDHFHGQHSKSITKQNLINQHMKILSNIIQKHAESS